MMRRSETREITQIVLAVVLLCTLIFVPILGFGALYEHQQCRVFQQADTRNEYRWFLWAGCMVQLESGRWNDANQPIYFEGEIK